MDHSYAGEQGQNMLGTVINSKGFGGNNASALILSPAKTKELMQQRHGTTLFKQYLNANEQVIEAQIAYDQTSRQEGVSAIYSFGESVMSEKDITMSTTEISLSEFANKISLSNNNPYLK
jgi:acetoacetyl-[acyl-carrier protein] synthase